MKFKSVAAILRRSLAAGVGRAEIGGCGYNIMWNLFYLTASLSLNVILSLTFFCICSMNNNSKIKSFFSIQNHTTIRNADKDTSAL